MDIKSENLQILEISSNVLSVKLLYCVIAGLNKGICSLLCVRDLERERESPPFIVKSSFSFFRLVFSPV